LMFSAATEKHNFKANEIDRRKAVFFYGYLSTAK